MTEKHGRAIAAEVVEGKGHTVGRWGAVRGGGARRHRPMLAVVPVADPTRRGQRDEEPRPGTAAGRTADKVG